MTETQRLHHAHLHVHEAWQGRDCDGIASGTSVWRLDRVPLSTIPDTPIADWLFEGWVMRSMVGFDPEFPDSIELSTERHTPFHDTERCDCEWGDDHDEADHSDCDCKPVYQRRLIEVSRANDEGGYHWATAAICEDPNCPEGDAEPTQRDHQAEAAGY